MLGRSAPGERVFKHNLKCTRTRLTNRTRQPSSLLRPQSRRQIFQVSRAAVSIQDLLQDCTALGAIRFIVMGDGAILESVSSLDRVAFTEVPNKGLYATISNPDKSFECHLNVAKVKEVKFAKNRAKSGLYDIYATRFVNDDGKVILSCILHGLNGEYSDKAVAQWTSLQQKYGDSVLLK